MELGLLFT